MPLPRGVVVGIGGVGRHAVRRMSEVGLRQVSFVAVDATAQVLTWTRLPTRGTSVTGCSPGSELAAARWWASRRPRPLSGAPGRVSRT